MIPITHHDLVTGIPVLTGLVAFGLGWLMARGKNRQQRQAAYLNGCDDGAADERLMWEASRDKSIWDRRFDLADATEALLAEAEAVLSAQLPGDEKRALPMAFDDETGTWEAVTAQLRTVPA